MALNKNITLLIKYLKHNGYFLSYVKNRKDFINTYRRIEDVMEKGKIRNDYFFYPPAYAFSWDKTKEGVTFWQFIEKVYTSRPDNIAKMIEWEMSKKR